MSMIARIIRFLGRYGLGVFGCLYVLTAGIFTARGRQALYDLLYRLKWRGRPSPVAHDVPWLIPAVPMGAYIEDERSIHVVAPDTECGNVSVDELVLINALVAARAPLRCFEIGTFDGRTTLNIAANTPDTAMVYTLDLPSSELGRTNLSIAHGDRKFIEKAISGARYRGHSLAGKIVQLYGDSATFDYTNYFGKMDFVFVDGAHSHDYVMKDTETALKLLKPEGGVIVWHDYSSPYWKGLTGALNEIYQRGGRLSSMRRISGTTLVVWEKINGAS